MYILRDNVTLNHKFCFLIEIHWFTILLIMASNECNSNTTSITSEFSLSPKKLQSPSSTPDSIVLISSPIMLPLGFCAHLAMNL